ncbi:MAG: hypothetical protein PVG39_00270 [Desulfobacteraceae bacterium]
MFQRKQFIMLLVMFITMVFLFGCPMMPTGAKSVSQMTPKEKVTWMYGVYNSQYADYQSMTGHIWDDTSETWKKTSSPTLSEDQKEILRKRKEILTRVYPIIKLYDSMLNSGAVPDRETEQKIIDLLNGL